MARRALIAASSALLIWAVITTVIAVTAGWPAELGGIGDPDRVSEEWATRGTLISPPLAPIVAQVLLTIAALREGRPWRILGAPGLAAIGVLYIVATLGEPRDPEASNPPQLLLGMFHLILILMSAIMTTAGLVTVVRAIRSRARDED